MGTGFTPEQKALILSRDAHLCCMCRQRATEANHRANRGAGGSRLRNGTQNGVALCNRCNGLIESDADQAERAREIGVKLNSWDDPAAIPYLHPLYLMPVWIRDDGDLEFARPGAVQG